MKQESNEKSSILGGTIVELAIALPILILVVLAGIDLARLAWIRSSVQHNVDLTLERAKSDERLAPLDWAALTGDVNYKQAIQDLNTFFAATGNELAELRFGLQYEGVQNSSGTAGQQLALLLPGGSAAVTNHGTKLNSFAPSVAPVIPPRAALRQFPIEIKTFPKVNTLLFGEKTFEISAAGFIPILSKTNMPPTSNQCGNGNRDGTKEECDPANDNSALPRNCSCQADCTIFCEPAKCGNGIFEPNTKDQEECDGASLPGWPANCRCNGLCKRECDPAPEFCGDGVLNQTPREQCEPSIPNSCGAGITCESDCTCGDTPRCGDGKVQPELNEDCEVDMDCVISAIHLNKTSCVNCRCTGNPNEPPNTPLCGNNIIDPGEDCDGTTLPPGCSANACTCNNCQLQCPLGNCIEAAQNDFTNAGVPLLTTYWGPDMACCPSVGSDGPKRHQDRYYPQNPVDQQAYATVNMVSVCPHNSGTRLDVRILPGCSALPCEPNTGCDPNNVGKKMNFVRSYGCVLEKDGVNWRFIGCQCVCPNKLLSWIEPTLEWDTVNNRWRYTPGRCPDPVGS